MELSKENIQRLNLRLSDRSVNDSILYPEIVFYKTEKKDCWLTNYPVHLAEPIDVLYLIKRNMWCVFNTEGKSTLISDEALCHTGSYFFKNILKNI